MTTSPAPSPATKLALDEDDERPSSEDMTPATLTFWTSQEEEAARPVLFFYANPPKRASRRLLTGVTAFLKVVCEVLFGTGVVLSTSHCELEPCLVGDWERGRIAGCLGGWYHYGLGRD